MNPWIIVAIFAGGALLTAAKRFNITDAEIAKAEAGNPGTWTTLGTWIIVVMYILSSSYANALKSVGG